jgi:glucosylceramidase
MILDERGGPWAISPIHGNPDPNEQHSVVVINRQTKQVSYTGLYYYLTHFSKFIRPGAVRVDTSGAVDGVRVMSFRNPDGNFIAELMNSRKEDVEVSLLFHRRTVRITLPAVSITTATWHNS